MFDGYVLCYRDSNQLYCGTWGRREGMFLYTCFFKLAYFVHILFAFLLGTLIFCSFWVTIASFSVLSALDSASTAQVLPIRLAAIVFLNKGHIPFFFVPKLSAAYWEPS